MSDPLSAAGSVAGLITLGAATSKLVYQFVSSVVDAPKEVRAITNSLYGVNIALCQIQTLLLDQAFAVHTTSEDLTDLEHTVSSCVASFSVVEKELNSVSHAGSKMLTVKKLWHQVKHVFEKEAMRDALAHLETEKGTLQLVLAALNSKSLGEVIRVVKDAEQVDNEGAEGCHWPLLSNYLFRITAVSLESICNHADIERMLTDYSSSLSLTLAYMTEDSASITIVPDNLSGVEIVSARIKFPVAPSDDASDTASILSATTEILHPSSSQHGGSSVDLTPESTRLPRLTAYRQKPSSIIQSLLTPNGVEIAGLALGVIPMISAFLQSVQQQSSELSLQLQNLQQASAQLERFAAFIQNTPHSADSSRDDYVTQCYKRVSNALTNYAPFIEKLYKDSGRRASLVQAIQSSSGKLEALWANVQSLMNELGRAINFALLLEIRESICRNDYRNENKRMKTHREVMDNHHEIRKRLSQIENGQRHEIGLLQDFFLERKPSLSQVHHEEDAEDELRLGADETPVFIPEES
ncbi:hypothetical protein K469DRAFT_758514 [Zopfia rhizophila CBS 207.26]|uniref:Azaphilone pigments biosynthesis cluster protein L N-terminal domain-containing protein n=1 Tax=Zopfia rhizophila CBS 207.26 TaxID=1314779 RepID=A0A6A6F012_9PEZI|nr:hypothetical protein K469DRAFT_758514 [Zopfia rhizophila CBS 207.26]